MKNIVVCIGNGLLSEAIIKMLKNSGEFKPFRVLIQKNSRRCTRLFFRPGR